MIYPYIATTSDGTKYTPQQGKIAIDKEFFIGPVQVIPAVGEKNRAHWRGLNNEPYLREFDHSGYEMSLWHSQQQIEKLNARITKLQEREAKLIKEESFCAILKRNGV